MKPKPARIGRPPKEEGSRKIRLTLTLSPDVYAVVTKYSEHHHLPVSVVIDKALRDVVDFTIVERKKGDLSPVLRGVAKKSAIP